MLRPLGITILAGLLILIGGFLTLVILFEFIFSWWFSGLEFVLIRNTSAFFGFIRYGFLPVVFYSTGVGLFAGRIWAYFSLLYIMPLALLVFAFHLAHAQARALIHRSGLSTLDLFLLQPQFLYF